MAYRELVAGAPFACVWTHDDGASVRRVLPDACADVLWAGGALWVAGPATKAVAPRIAGGGPVLGVRFRVGAAGAGLGLPAAELRDLTVPLASVWGRGADELAERVAEARAPLAALAAGLCARAARGDALVRAAAAGTARDALGVGERQLRRRFDAAVGFGPATLRRILRFQRFLRLTGGSAVDGGDGLARLALAAGYADQAHLTRECRRLAGLTPAALLATGADAAGDRTLGRTTAGAGMSGSFKTTAGRSPKLAA